MSRREYDAIIVEKRSVVKKKSGGYIHCRKKVFKPGVYQKILSEKIWNATHASCGYNFKNHFLDSDATSGSLNGAQ